MDVTFIQVPRMYVGRVEGRLEPYVQRATERYLKCDTQGSMTENYTWERDLSNGLYVVQAMLGPAFCKRPESLTPDNLLFSVSPNGSSRDSEERERKARELDMIAEEFQSRTSLALVVAPREVARCVTGGLITRAIREHEFWQRRN